MLKRTVVIGVLLMLALALTAFGPDAPQPPDVPAQGELEVEIDGWTVYFLWGITGTAPINSVPVARQVDPPPSEVAEAYAQLPPEISPPATPANQEPYNRRS